MGGGNNSGDGNVIIPDVGAGKYWYTDPSASGVPTPANAQQFDPTQYADEQGHDRPDPQSQELMRLQDALHRIGAIPDQPNPTVPINWGSNERRSSSYKTTIMDIGNEQWEVPVPEEFRKETQGPPSQWPQKIMAIMEDRARDNLERGYDPFGDPLPQTNISF